MESLHPCVNDHEFELDPKFCPRDLKIGQSISQSISNRIGKTSVHKVIYSLLSNCWWLS